MGDAGEKSEGETEPEPGTTTTEPIDLACLYPRASYDVLWHSYGMGPFDPSSINKNREK